MHIYFILFYSSGNRKNYDVLSVSYSVYCLINFKQILSYPAYIVNLNFVFFEHFFLKQFIDTLTP